jgi:type II secretory pathway pseudopilin PulG
MRTLEFILKSLLEPPHWKKRQRWKQQKPKRRAEGFTLIELLVAIILTFLIITPLLGLVINLMNNDRQEQAKNASQQEIQAALNYIAQDLQQAVYIYDATGLSKTNGIGNQIPPEQVAPGCTDTATCVPVLAFWKRKFLGKNDTVKDDNGNDIQVRNIDDVNQGSDKYVYSLVVYYLVKDGSPTWSPVARIGRFEIRGNVAGQTVSLPANDGFADFPSGGTPAAMNGWLKNPNKPYTQSVQTLIDYVDDTLIADFPASVKPRVTPPPNGAYDASASPPITAPGCRAQTGVGSSRVPPAPLPANLDTGSFYACVNPANTQGQSVVQVYLRGNALPRLNPNPVTWKVGVGNEQNQLSNRPIASVRIAVRSSMAEQ